MVLKATIFLTIIDKKIVQAIKTDLDFGSDSLTEIEKTIYNIMSYNTEK